MTKITTILLLGMFLTCANASASVSGESMAFQKASDRIQKKYLIAAVLARQKLNYAKAIELYEAAASKWEKQKFASEEVQEACYTSSISCLMGAAALHRHEEKFDRAAEDYLKCEEIARRSKHRKDGTYLPWVAEAYRDGKSYDKAKSIYDTLIKSTFSVGPYATDPHIGLAQVYEECGQDKRAEKILLEFLEGGCINGKPLIARAARVALRDLFMRQHRKDEAGKIVADLDDKHCPICHSASPVIPIGYGLTVGSDGSFRSGGCVVTKYSARWWCTVDKCAF